MPNEIWWKWANFAVLAGGLGYLIGKNAGPFFRSRTEEIQKGIRDAAEVRAEAEARAAAIESKIGNLSGEIERILKATSKAEIAAEGARIQAETQAQIAKIQAQAEMEIASATKQATARIEGVLGATRARDGREANSRRSSIRRLRKIWPTRS